MCCCCKKNWVASLCPITMIDTLIGLLTFAPFVFRYFTLSQPQHLQFSLKCKFMQIMHTFSPNLSPCVGKGAFPWIDTSFSTLKTNRKWLIDKWNYSLKFWCCGIWYFISRNPDFDVVFIFFFLCGLSKRSCVEKESLYLDFKDESVIL